MRKYSNLLWIFVTLICCICLLLLREPSMRFFLGCLLMFFLPGYASTKLIFKHSEIDTIERLCASGGLSIAISSILFLIAYYLSDRITLPLMLTVISAFSVLAFGLKHFRNQRVHDKRIHRKSISFVVLLVLLASFFRLTHLGYSEYQGDEAEFCAGVSREILKGNNEILITQIKPPIQAIITTTAHLFFNTTNEFFMRFPFTLVGILGVVLFYVLGRNMFNEFIGGVSGILAAMNGYFIIFSRIVQYQSVVILSVSLSLLFLYKFLKSYNECQIWKFLMMGIFFSGFAVLTHYDGLFVLPLVLLVLILKCRTSVLKRPWLLFFSSITLFLFITGLFYGPFLLHPHFAETVKFYKSTRFDSSLFHFQKDVLMLSGALYNSGVYIYFLIFASCFAFFRKISPELLIILVWFAFSFIYWMVVSARPQTHIHNYFVPWCYLASVGLENIFRFGKKIPWPRLRCLHRFIPSIGLATVTLIAGIHIYRVFVHHDPEFIWNHRPGKAEKFGIFGFPYHRGWKAIGYLFRTKELEGPYLSNEKPKITRYYLDQIESSNYKYLIVLPTPQSWNEIDIPHHFSPSIQILYKGKPAMTIYENAENITQLVIYHSEEFERRYDKLDRVL